MKKVFIISISLIIVVLSSCSNFLESKQLKDDIEKAIFLANAEPFSIKFFSDQGFLSPSGIQSYKETQTVQLNFDVNSNYYFKHWQVSIGNKVLTQEEVEEIIHFEDFENPITTITLLKRIENLSITPVCGTKPSVIEGTPRYSTDGVFRDRMLMVLFSQEMDESSIYYSTEDLRSLKIINENETVGGISANLNISTGKAVSGTGKLLLIDVDRNTCYGYQTDADDEETIVFKNIQIYKRKTNENILKSYNAPYFEQSDKSVLKIPAKTGNDAPSALSEIVVEISKEMNASIDNQQVMLNGQYIWPYNTNGRTDSIKPVFDTSFTVKMDDNNSTKLLPTESTYFATTPETSIPLYNLKSKKLWVMGMVTDEGSGPASLSWKLESEANTYYSEVNISNCFGMIDNLYFSGDTAIIGSNKADDGGVEIDLSKYLSTQGIYKLTFTVKDKNELSQDKSYYFIYDVTPPEGITVTRTLGKSNNILVYFTNQSVPDLCGIKRINNDSNEVTLHTAASCATGKLSIPESTSGIYHYSLKTYDYAGNESSVASFEEASGAVNGMFVYYIKNEKENDSEATFYTSLKYIKDLDKNTSVDKFNSIRSLIGIVCDGNDITHTRIVGLTNSTSWYSSSEFQMTGFTSSSTNNGLETYKTLLSQNTKTSGWQDIVNMNSKYYDIFRWYLPALDEMTNIDIAKINNCLNGISNVGKIDGSKYLTSTFYSTDQSKKPSRYVQNGNTITINNKNDFDLRFRPMTQINLATSQAVK